jgi:hypothetical protein
MHLVLISAQLGNCQKFQYWVFINSTVRLPVSKDMTSKYTSSLRHRDNRVGLAPQPLLFTWIFVNVSLMLVRIKFSEQNSNYMHINLFKISTHTCFGPNGPSSGCYRHRIPNTNLSVQCKDIVYVGEWGPCISWLKMSNVKILMGHVLCSAVYSGRCVSTHAYIWYSVSVTPWRWPVRAETCSCTNCK